MYGQLAPRMPHPLMKSQKLSSHVCLPSAGPYLGSTDRGLAEKSLTENREGTALRLLANVGADGDKVVNACGSDWSYTSWELICMFTVDIRFDVGRWETMTYDWRNSDRQG